MTALCVAIPAMFGYNFLVTSIRGMIVEMDNFAAELASEFEHKYVEHGGARLGFSTMKTAISEESRNAGTDSVPENVPAFLRSVKDESDMRRYSNRTSLSTLSEINITPLLDLAFVLLIIFMITTPLLENSKTLIIPSSATTNAPINPAAVQTLSIDRNEVVRLNEEVVDPAALESRLAR